MFTARYELKLQIQFRLISVFITYLLTYSIEQSPSCEELVLELVKKFPAFFGNRRFITVLTSARHLSLSWANSIQSPQPPPTSWRSILILSSHLRLSLLNGLFPSGSFSLHFLNFLSLFSIFHWERGSRLILSVILCSTWAQSFALYGSLTVCLLTNSIPQCYTDMRRLTTGILSEKCVVRRLRRCVNVY